MSQTKVFVIAFVAGLLGGTVGVAVARKIPFLARLTTL